MSSSLKKTPSICKFYQQEDELTKLRRAIEDQRIKVEQGGKGSLHHRSGSDGYSAMIPGNHIQRHNGKVNGAQSSEIDNVYPVFVHPDQENWNRSTSASQTNGTPSSSRGSTLMRNSGGKNIFQDNVLSDVSDRC